MMKFPCPLCSSLKEVRINRKSKPYLRCDDCGVLMFVNRPTGIRIIQAGKDLGLDKPKQESADSFLFGK